MEVFTHPQHGLLDHLLGNDHQSVARKEPMFPRPDGSFRADKGALSSSLYLPDLARWKQLMSDTLLGSRAEYEALLREFDGWLEIYFTAQGFAKDRDQLIRQTLRSVHNKLHTYQPTQCVLSWLVTLAEYRLHYPARH